MDELNISQLNFDVELLQPLQNLVAKSSPFVISPSNIKETYDLIEYIRASNYTDTELKVLLDNNILTRAIYIAKGKKICGDLESQKVLRIACGVMCFFILGGFVIEPNMSLYEKASNSSHDEAVSEYFYFKVADNMHPQLFAELALGIRDSAPAEDIENSMSLVLQNPKRLNENNFAKTLNPWKVNYLFLLKAVELWKCKPDKTEAAKEFIKWMENDSFFNGIAALFVLLLFSPARAPKMIKGIDSTNTEKLRSGIKNCAWDLAYITQWSGFAREARPETIWFLCSHDKLMKQIANTVFPKLGVSQEKVIEQLFTMYWGNKKGLNLFGVYQETVSAIEKKPEQREIRNKQKFLEVDLIIEQLEESLGI